MKQSEHSKTKQGLVRGVGRGAWLGCVVIHPQSTLGLISSISITSRRGYWMHVCRWYHPQGQRSWLGVPLSVSNLSVTEWGSFLSEACLPSPSYPLFWLSGWRGGIVSSFLISQPCSLLSVLLSPCVINLLQRLHSRLKDPLHSFMDTTQRPLSW